MYFALTEFKDEWVSTTPETVGPADNRYGEVKACFEKKQAFIETNKAWGRTTTTYYKVAITAPPSVQEIEEIQEIEEYKKSEFLLRQEREIEEYRKKEENEKKWIEENTSESFFYEALRGLQALESVEQATLDQYLGEGFPLLSMIDIQTGEEGSLPYGAKTLGDIPPGKRIVLWAETPTKKALRNYRQIYAPDWGAYLPDDFPQSLGDVWIEDPDIPVNTAYACSQAYAVHRDRRFNVLNLIPFKLKKPWVKTNYPYEQDDGRSPFGCRWDG